jgi:rhodanese-related sulfurtransferase
MAKGDCKMRRNRIRLVIGMMLAGALAAPTQAQQPSAQGVNAPSIYHGVISNFGSGRELSTGELQQVLMDSTAIVLDARPYEEYAVSHIPGARSIRGKPDTTPALYVADASEVVESLPDRNQALVLYCNGLYCGRSERFAEELMSLGYRNVTRYQLGAPGWRSLGGVMQVEKPALLRLLGQDKTSVLVDGRARADSKPRLKNAVWIPLREASKAKDDGRLPMTDHNTRIFVVAGNGHEARNVADAIVRDAFHNVTFFDGTIADLPELLDEES